MAVHTVRSFGEELEQLQGDVTAMGGLCEHLIAAALDAVVRRDLDAAERAIAGDARVDAMQRELERRVIRLLALRQPLARDLRQVVAALKISTNLERVGDLARNVARRAKALAETEPVEPVSSVDRMGALVADQLRAVLDAYVHGDADAAMRVWRRDSDIDEHYGSLFLELVDYMREDPSMVPSGAHLLFVAKNLERVGDHATNIAEVVQFLVTGEEVDRERPKSDMTTTAAAAIGGEGR